MLRLKDAFSAHIAHWSSGSAWYFPNGCGRDAVLVVLFSDPLYSAEWSLEGKLEMDAVTRLNRRRIFRAFIKGRRKRRNSYHMLVAVSAIALERNLTVNACQTICLFINS